MQATVLQINISRGGVPKRPVDQAVLTPLGVEGDVCAHPDIHGGPQRAVLLICSEVIDELIGRGYPLFYGALGENLTTRGLDRRWMRLGQRYRIGDALVELTSVRAPCSALEIYSPDLPKEVYDKEVKAGSPASPRWGMSGFYAAVARPGLVRQHDIITLVDELA